MAEKRCRLRRILAIAGIVVGTLVVLLGGLTVATVYKPIHTRGAGAVSGTAPDFTLPDQAGAPVALADLVAHGPAVVVFYRGFW